MCALNGLRPIVLVLATSFAVLGLCDTAVNTSDTAVNSSNTPDTVVGPPGAPRTKRLTTFGKSANMPSPSPPLSAGIVVGAAGITECSTQLDCELIQYTECRVLSTSTGASDGSGTRAVCLCMDNALPVNGACSARPRALRTPCNSDNECLEGAECIINPNATVNINQRMCYCMPGWLEVEGYCNGSSIESASILITLTFAVLLATYSQM
ncbi:uncharacterized protein LOC111049130 isoform X2 [Nilaparvata lugens]|uniref:uncharacterized protein LOC111049130 isoform X2 n=1 Tax=Nilaparvata lugens TaxID=108931 RepID=UPI000B98E49C|nr:uncharacterized protein LOC111049130 isoform X2 [Nilaparvata lugens]